MNLLPSPEGSQGHLRRCICAAPAGPCKNTHIAYRSCAASHLFAGYAPAGLFVSLPYQFSFPKEEGLDTIQSRTKLCPAPARQLLLQSVDVVRHKCRYVHTEHPPPECSRFSFCIFGFWSSHLCHSCSHTSTVPVYFPCDRKSSCKKPFLKIFTKNRKFTLCSLTFRP